MRFVILETKVEKPYLLKASGIEGLKKARELSKAGVPFIVDDMKPGRPAGNKKCMDVDLIKTLLNIEVSETIASRYEDLLMDKDQPRIFTTNAMTCEEWYPMLPSSPTTLSPDERLALAPDVKAIFKRCVFAFCDKPMIPPAASKRRWEDKEAEATTKIARVLR